MAYSTKEVGFIYPGSKGITFDGDDNDIGKLEVDVALMMILVMVIMMMMQMIDPVRGQ